MYVLLQLWKQYSSLSEMAQPYVKCFWLLVFFTLSLFHNYVELQDIVRNGCLRFGRWLQKGPNVRVIVADSNRHASFQVLDLRDCFRLCMQNHRCVAFQVSLGSSSTNCELLYVASDSSFARLELRNGWTLYELSETESKISVPSCDAKRNEICPFCHCLDFCKDEYGCNCTCKVPLGMESRKIQEYQLTATSWHDGFRLPKEGRLHNNVAWCGSQHRPKDEFTITFKQVTTVVSVATQGNPPSDKWVTKYKLQFFVEALWHVYSENGIEREFDGNVDRDTIVLNTLRVPQNARKIKFVLIARNGVQYCMRVEVYGCVP